jgi:hypothetical protein
MVCQRIRNKFQASLPRMARACYSAPSPKEALLAARHEYDVLLAELATLGEEGTPGEFEVVRDDDANGETGPTAA